MMMTYMDVLMSHERRSDRMHEAEEARLLQKTPRTRATNRPVYAPALARVGACLQSAGKLLQAGGASGRSELARRANA